MIMTGVFLLMTNLAHAQKVSTVALWNDCIQSYKASKTLLLDVNFDEKNDQQLIFRNGKHFAPDALNILHAGQFWTTELKIESGFYDKKTILVIMGNEKFCLKQEFNWLRSDNFVLIPFHAKTCVYTQTYNLSQIQKDAKPSPETILETKLFNSVDLGLYCLKRPQSQEQGGCSLEDSYAEYQRLLKWNTKACEKIDNPKIQKLIADKKSILSEFATQAALDAPLKVPKVKLNKDSDKKK